MEQPNMKQGELFPQSSEVTNEQPEKSSETKPTEQELAELDQKDDDYYVKGQW